MHSDVVQTEPLFLYVHDFVTPAEAQALIARADKLFVRSPVLCPKHPGGCMHSTRTSSSAFLPSDALTQAISARASDFAMLPRVEPLQVVRYTAGQEFQPHLDAYGNDVAGRDAYVRQGGQRAATLFVYLNTVPPGDGGETVFPKLGFAFQPILGSALYWHNVLADRSINPNALHGGAPVKRGIKYGLNIWLIEPRKVTRGYAPVPNAMLHR